MYFFYYLKKKWYLLYTAPLINMKLFIKCCVFAIIITDVIGFQLNMYNNNDLQLKKKTVFFWQTGICKIFNW